MGQGAYISWANTENVSQDVNGSIDLPTTGYGTSISGTAISIGPIDFTKYSTLHIIAKPWASNSTTSSTIQLLIPYKATSLQYTYPLQYGTYGAIINGATGKDEEKEYTISTANLQNATYLGLISNTTSTTQAASVSIKKIWLTE